MHLNLREGSLKARPRVVFGLLQKAMNSPEYARSLKLIVEDTLGLLESSAQSVTEIRNTVHAALLLNSFGFRGEAIRKITVKEWENREQLEEGGSCISIAAHKTSQVYGVAKLLLHDEVLEQAVTGYLRHARPFLVAQRPVGMHVAASEDLIFLTQ